MDSRPFVQDEAAAKFLKLLEEREFKTTYCDRCKRVVFPPKVVCPFCLEETSRWVDLPREGVLYAFTYQEAGFRCAYPEVLGLVELEGIGRILTRVDAPFEELNIGMPVELDFFTSADGLTLHQFRPRARKGE